MHLASSLAEFVGHTCDLLGASVSRTKRPGGLVLFTLVFIALTVTEVPDQPYLKDVVLNFVVVFS